MFSLMHGGQKISVECLTVITSRITQYLIPHSIRKTVGFLFVSGPSCIYNCLSVAAGLRRQFRFLSPKVTIAHASVSSRNLMGVPLYEERNNIC